MNETTDLKALKEELKLAGKLTRLPPVALTLLVVFAVIHFWVMTLAGGEHERAIFFLLLSGAKVNALIESGEWWRLVSSVFFHGTFSHLLVNSLGVLLLGWFLENRMGAFALLLTFVLSGVVGSVGSYLLTPSPSVGASGGMFGLLGATLSYSLVRWREIPRFIRAYVIGLPATVGVFSLGYGFFEGSVDNFAHLGGGFCGVVLGFVFSRDWRMENKWQLSAVSLVKASLVLVTVFCIGAGLAHLKLRFDLPQTRLGSFQLSSGTETLYPLGWEPGVFKEGQCVQLGRLPQNSDVACFVDPYYSMFLVAPADNLMTTPIFTEYVKRRLERPASIYKYDRIMWAADPGRRVEFALLAFDEIADKYVPLFAALQADPRSGAKF